MYVEGGIMDSHQLTYKNVCGRGIMDSPCQLIYKNVCGWEDYGLSPSVNIQEYMQAGRGIMDSPHQLTYKNI